MFNKKYKEESIHISKTEKNRKLCINCFTLHQPAYKYCGFCGNKLPKRIDELSDKECEIFDEFIKSYLNQINIT